MQSSKRNDTPQTIHVYFGHLLATPGMSDVQLLLLYEAWCLVT